MEFGKHIGKGLWAFADKALPALYGIGFIFLVVRALPEREYGAFVIVQTIFTVVSMMAIALALQPLTKFAAEKKENGPYIVAALTLTATFFALGVFIFVGGKRFIIPYLDPDPHSLLLLLFNYLPLTFFTAWYRIFSISLLQASYDVRKIFWIDAAYFLGTLILVYCLSKMHMFNTAEDLLRINIMTQAASSFLALVFTAKTMSVSLRFKKDAFGEMFRFGKFTFGTNSIYTLLTQMDVFFVSSFVGLGGVAVYNATKIITRIFDMASQVLQMFLIPFSSKNYALGEKGKLVVTIEKAICFSSLILLPVFLVSLIVPRELLHFLYHGKYDHGANILRVFGLMALVVPWNSAVVSYIIGIGKVRDVFYISIIYLAVTVPVYWLLTPLLGAVGTSIGLVTTFLVITVILVRYVQKIIPFTLMGVVRRFEDAWRYAVKKGQLI